MNAVETVATAVAAAGAGAAGGVYLAFSAMVIPALNSLPAGTAVAAMQRINVLAIRPPFMIVFFGGAVSSVAAAITGGSAEYGVLRIAGAALTLASFGLTLAVNVPLNDALARMASGSNDAASWCAFAGPWKRTNTLRGVLALAGAAALAGSLAG